MSPAPSTNHQALLVQLALAIGRAIEGTDCAEFVGPFDVFPFAQVGASLGDSDLDVQDTVVQPDLIVVCDRAKLIERGCVGAPDLVIEIGSPSTMSKDLSVKPDLYERARIGEYWFVVPADRTILVFVLGDDGTYPLAPQVHERRGTVISQSLPQVRIDIEEMFERARL